MSAVLRSARAEDAADVVRVLRASRLRFLSYAPPVHSEDEHLAWARDALIPSGGVTLAAVDDHVIGVLAVSRAQGANWIDQLYIQPEYCGRGVGSQPMKVALSSLRRPIRLYTFQQNAGACRFYERFGFSPIGWGDGSENEEGCPDVLYELVDDTADDA
jgi:GNAT superfamily N-acetyltransferase